MGREYLSTAFEIKELDDVKGTIEGYGSIFGNVDFGNDIVKRGAFADSLKTWAAKNRSPKMLWQHDSREPIGKWDVLKEDRTGLYVKGRLFVDDIPRAKQAYTLLKEGAMEGLSIGYVPEEAIMDDRKGTRTITKAQLFEVSPVTFAMNDAATVTGVKSFDESCAYTVRQLEEILRDAGFSREQAKAFIAHARKSEPREASEDDPAQRLMKAMREATQQLAKV
nr:HK97 family phage prohead protease [uncultured Roseateles sp.]